eukprot:scaffold1052_cov339-Pavlova_lutheri.AAC.60
MREEIELPYCPTETMWADYLTKQVPAPKFKECLKNLGLILPSTMQSGSVGSNTPSLGIQHGPRQTGDPPNEGLPSSRDGKSGNDDEANALVVNL